MTVPFNAWTDPWLLIKHRERGEVLASLRDVFLHADAYGDLGAALTPLDRDSLYRFLPAVGAVIARHISDDDLDRCTENGKFTAEAVEAFEKKYLDRFALVGEKPFMQRWDHAQEDLNAFVGKKKSGGPVIAEIDGLHPHAPGGSSSKWAVRRDTKTDTDWATVALLLVTAWFQTRCGANSKDPWGHGLTSGSAGSWRPRALAVHLLADTFGSTMYANMPEAWVERTDLPVFLDHAGMPRDAATEEIGSVWRFTYAKTLPLLHVVDDQPVGFIIGPDAGIPIPPLDADEKEALKAVHHGDHTRLYYEATKKDGRTERKAVGSLGAALGTVEGATRWFLNDGHVKEGLVRVRNLERAGGPYSEAAWKDMRLGVFNETADKKGLTRTWADWSEIASRAAGFDDYAVLGIETLLGYIATCRSAFFHACREATGDSKPSMVDRAQADFLAAAAPVVSGSIDAAACGRADDLVTRLTSARSVAAASFRAAVAPLNTPSSISNVARAIGWYDRRVAAALYELAPELAPATTDKETAA